MATEMLPHGVGALLMVLALLGAATRRNPVALLLCGALMVVATLLNLLPHSRLHPAALPLGLVAVAGVVTGLALILRCARKALGSRVEGIDPWRWADADPPAAPSPSASSRHVPPR